MEFSHTSARMIALVTMIAAALWLATCPTFEAKAAKLIPLASEQSWNSAPIYATSPKGDGNRVFVAERGGRIRTVQNGTLQNEPFLALSNVDVYGERGLLSFAFAPDYAATGLFYVLYTAAGPDGIDPTGDAGDIRIVEFRRSQSDPNKADPASGRLVLARSHQANHNAGWMAFGPDNHLYFTIGDNLTPENAQDLSNLHGKILRIDPADPDGAGSQRYLIPTDNPFYGQPGVRGEIFTYGLRNPYRASFKPDGELVVADVGGQYEEINAGDLKGKNLGWPDCSGPCVPPNPLLVDPLFAYDHSVGGTCAIIGGYVVRDPNLTGLHGKYLYGDLCSQALRTHNLIDSGGTGQAGITLGQSNEQLYSLGEDGVGCVYVLTIANAYRVAPSGDTAKDCPLQGSTPDNPNDPDPELTLDLKLSAKNQKLSSSVLIQVRCSIACRVTSSGTVKVPRGNKPSQKAKLGAVSKSLTQPMWTKLRLKLRPSTLLKARSAAASGKKVKASIVVKATTQEGSSKKTASIVLRKK